MNFKSAAGRNSKLGFGLTKREIVKIISMRNHISRFSENDILLALIARSFDANDCSFELNQARIQMN